MRNSATEILMAGFGAFLFSAYIIYDTQLIMRHLSAEEYIIGVLNLYMDIVNLFVKVLRLLHALQQTQEKKNEKKRRWSKTSAQIKKIIY